MPTTSVNTPRPLRVPKRKASTYSEVLFEAQKKQLARKLVDLRLSQGLSQEALAYEAEVERGYVSLIERGRSNPSLRVLCQLAQRLGVSVAEMMGEPLTSYDNANKKTTTIVIHEPTANSASTDEAAPIPKHS